MMEGLGRKIRQAKVVDSVKGLQLFEEGHVLTHQQFVDDTMLQGIPTVKEALAYKKILKDFAMASGLEVNLSKSIFFSLILTFPYKGTLLELWASNGSSSPRSI